MPSSTTRVSPFVDLMSQPEARTRVQACATRATLLRLVVVGTLAAATSWSALRADTPAGEVPYTVPRDTSDIRGYGARLDGTSDDAEALRRAFRAVGPTGKIVIPAGGRLRLASTVTLNLGSARGFSLVCDSPVVADSGIGNAIEIVNGYPKFIEVLFQGGGKLADYRQADPPGADQGLYLRGIRGGEIKVKAYGYKGRVIRVTKEQPGEPKSSMLYFSNIETGDHTDPCGQAWYMDGYSAFGLIGRAWVFWDKYGPIFNGLHDLTINAIEGGWRSGTNGLRFEGCSAVHIGKLALGDETQTVDLLTFTMNARRKRWHNVHVEEAFLLKGRRGVVFEHSDDEGYVRGTFYSKITKEAGMTVTDVKKFDLKHISYQDGTGIVVSGDTRTRLGRLDLMVTEPREAGAVLPIREDLMVKGFIAHLEEKLARDPPRPNERRGETVVLNNVVLPEFIPTGKAPITK